MRLMRRFFRERAGRGRLYQTTLSKTLTCIVALVGVLVIGRSLVETLALHIGKAPPGVVSFELWDAPPAPTAERRVALWLGRHASDLARAERRFGVDRRAVGAAIAYEALADPRTGTFGRAARFSGPGKVHYREHRLSEGDPAAKQVEELGYLPHLDMEARRAALAKAPIAIAYIAAIMAAFVRDDPTNGARLACEDAHLVTLYTAWKPSDFARRSLANVRDNDAGVWTDRHAAFLDDAIGPSPRCP